MKNERVVVFRFDYYLRVRLVVQTKHKAVHQIHTSDANAITVGS